MTQEQTPAMGHNKPPSDAEILTAKLLEDHAKVLERAKALVASAAKIPTEFDDEENAQKVTTFIKQVTVCKNALEDARKVAKAPSLLEGKMVDTFFAAHDSSLKKAIADAKIPLDKYTDKKDEAERQRLREAEAAKNAEVEAMMTVAVAVASTDVGAGEMALEDALMAEADAGKLKVASQAKTGLGSVRTDDGATAYKKKTTVGEIVDVGKLDLNALRFLIPLPALQTALNGYIRAGGTELAGTRIWEKSETVVR